MGMYSKLLLLPGKIIKLQKYAKKSLLLSNNKYDIIPIHFSAIFVKILTDYPEIVLAITLWSVEGSVEDAIFLKYSKSTMSFYEWCVLSFKK